MGVCTDIITSFELLVCAITAVIDRTTQSPPPTASFPSGCVQFPEHSIAAADTASVAPQHVPSTRVTSTHTNTPPHAVQATLRGMGHPSNSTANRGAPPAPWGGGRFAKGSTGPGSRHLPPVI